MGCPGEDLKNYGSVCSMFRVNRRRSEESESKFCSAEDLSSAHCLSLLGPLDDSLWPSKDRGMNGKGIEYTVKRSLFDNCTGPGPDM